MESAFAGPTSHRETGETSDGITLLEAYSSLANQQDVRAAVEIPFPGHPLETDPEGNFWRMRVQKVG